MVLPTALTRACYETCVQWTAADRKRSRAMQDERGRLWDVVWMGHFAALSNSRLRRRADPGRLHELLPPAGEAAAGATGRKQQQILKLILGVGADGSPCWTIAMRDEDWS